MPLTDRPPPCLETRQLAALRVLSVAHTAVQSAAGRLRYRPLANDPSLDVRLVVPARWHQFGRWYTADPDDDPDIAVTSLPILFPRAGPASWYLHAYPGLGKVARALAPDVIHLWEEPWSLVALQACVLARRGAAAFVLEVDQNILKRLPPPFEWIRRQVLRRTDLILSRSRDASDVVRACGYTGPIRPIGYGVDEHVFRPGPRPPRLSPLQLGYVGRIVEDKGLDDVLSAMAQVRAPVQLSILGEGPHAPALRRRAAELGLADRVSFRPWGDPAVVASFLHTLHALVLPSRTNVAFKEQFGRVIIEAQACGVPVIGAATGSIPDVIGDGGWVVPERAPRALASLLERLAAAEPELSARGRLGLANVASRFRYEVTASELAQSWRQAALLRRTEAGTALEGARS